MSIIVHELSYMHPDREKLFSGISFSVPSGSKASLIGDNGSGKSVLLRILAGELHSYVGEFSVSGGVYYVPQHCGQYDHSSIARVLGISAKLAAMDSILRGGGTEQDFTVLDEDWDIEERALAALHKWNLHITDLLSPLNALSGGEKTKVFLAGIDIHAPGVILMDEPTNHIDRAGRAQLYRHIATSRATMLIVSHDRELLELPDTTFELSAHGLRRYGGNYDFYREQKVQETAALEAAVSESEKAARKARAIAREVAERKQKKDSRGEKKLKKEGVPRIMMNTIRDGAERTAAGLQARHAGKLEAIMRDTREMRAKLPAQKDLKMAFGNSGLHDGKILFNARGINFHYPGKETLWPVPLDLLIASGDRIAVLGGNGSGKTTLVKIIEGQLEPTSGLITRVPFSHVYVDQEYSMIESGLTVLEQLQRYNKSCLTEHELRTELHRFLFPAGSWDKGCSALSGGEKLRLLLCCMVVGESSPDVFLLDEPTNNLDLKSMEILTRVIREYKGTVVVISHDSRFVKDIGVDTLVSLQ